MTEENLIKVYDEDGNDGGSMTRVAAERDGKVIATVVTAIFDSEYNVWLSLRSHNKSTHPGMWDITSAGCVDHSDASNLMAAQRELLEETGLDIELKSAGKKKFVFMENGQKVVRYPEVFGAVTDEIPRIMDEEADGFARFPLEVFEANFDRYPDLFIVNIKDEIRMAYKALKGGNNGEKIQG